MKNQHNTIQRNSSPDNSSLDQFQVLHFKPNQGYQPMSQWRKRAPRACVQCRKAHACCGLERPCKRCVRLGLGCLEAVQKKRGRKKKKPSNTNNYAQPTSSSSDNDSISPQPEECKLSPLSDVALPLSPHNNVFKEPVGMLLSTQVPKVDRVNTTILKKWGFSTSDKIESWFDLLHPSSMKNAAAEYISLSMEEVRQRVMVSPSGGTLPTKLNSQNNTSTVLINSSSIIHRQYQPEIVSRGRDLGIDSDGRVFEFCRMCLTVFEAEYPHNIKYVLSYFWW
eukprot:gb/GECH01004049.1/.p1 GENE.gb/GECH01004049.1/~~gb/GECH01004049.1/.p1  ORF type:complete len:280 (+),score=45.19 gb/GECH01004049.1/:1-840(+)